MAFSVSEPTAEVNAGTASSLSFAAFTPNANDLLVVFGSCYALSSSPSLSNTGTSLTWTKQQEQVWGTADISKCALWYAQCPGSTSSSTITMSAATPWGSASLAILTISGHSTSPIVQAVSGQADSSTSIGSISCSSINTNNLTIIGCGAYAGFSVGAWATEPSSYTKTADILGGTTFRTSMWYRTSGQTGTTTPSATMGTSTDLMMLFMEIALAGGARSFCSGIIG